MEANTCNACGRTLALRPQNPNQNYCSNPEGQRERRWRWQQQKRRDDAEYRDHNARTSHAWTCTTDERGNSGAVARQRQQPLLHRAFEGFASSDSTGRAAALHRGSELEELNFGSRASTAARDFSP